SIGQLRRAACSAANRIRKFRGMGGGKNNHGSTFPLLAKSLFRRDKADRRMRIDHISGFGEESGHSGSGFLARGAISGKASFYFRKKSFRDLELSCSRQAVHGEIDEIRIAAARFKQQTFEIA